jgi:hypothetical protein
MEKLFNSGSKKNDENNGYIRITLNDKIQPADRYPYYEDVLDIFLQENEIGEITGGGTLQEKTGEIKLCDIDIQLYNEDITEEEINKIINFLDDKKAPKNSIINIYKQNKTISFGKTEGLGLYLDGINLDKEVYMNCDINFVISEIKRLIGDNSDILRYWEGPEKTALYFYGESFLEMKNNIAEFVNKYPLCKNAVIKQIA